MKFLKHFNFGSEADDFRRGKVFVEDDSKKEVEGGNGEENLDLNDTLKQILSRLTALEEKKSKNTLSIDENSELQKLKKQAQNLETKAKELSDNAKVIGGNVDKILAGESITELPETPEVTEKTAEELELEAKNKKEVAEKADAIGDEIKSKTANALGDEKKENPEDKQTETEQKTKDDAEVKSTKYGLGVDYNKNREQQNLDGHNKREKYAEKSRKTVYNVAERIEYEGAKESKKVAEREERDRENLKDVGKYETAKLDGYNNFMRNFLDEDTKKLVAELDTFRDEKFNRLKGIQLEFKKNSAEPNVVNKRIKQQELQRELNELVRDLQPGGKDYKQFEAYEKKIEDRMNAMLGGKSKFKYKGEYRHGELKDNGAVRGYFLDLNKSKDKYLSSLKNIQKIGLGYNNSPFLTGKESFWESLNDRTAELGKFYNFDVSEPTKDDDGKAIVKSKFQQDVEYLKSDIDETVDGTTYLENAGFWKDKNNFRENLQQQQKNVGKGVQKLKESIRDLEKLIDKKSWLLNDADFSEKFGESKQEAKARIDEMRSQLAKTQHRMSELMKPDYYDKWIFRYNNPKTRADAIRDISFFQQLDGNEGFIEKLQEKKKEIDQAISNDAQRYTKASLYDIYKMFEGYFEKREEDWQSRSKLAVAEMGTAFTHKDSPMNSKFARELKNAQESEKTEAEEALQNRSTGEIKSKFLYKTNDIYMFWACVEKLQDRSDFIWRDRYVLATINRINRANGGPDIFKANDWSEMPNEKLRVTIEKWVKSQPELGVAKANLWTDDFFADGMKKADDDYASEANLAVANKARFVDTVTADFATFSKNPSDPEAMSKVDKGYILAFMRLALKRRKMNSGFEGDEVLWLLIQGLAIGFFTPADIDKIESEYKGGFPLLSFLIDSRHPKKNGRIVDGDLEPNAKDGPWEMQDYKQWALQLNGNKIPKTAADFSLGNDKTKLKRFKEFYVQNISNSTEVDSTFYNAFVPNIKNADFADLSLYSMKFKMKNATELLQSTSDGTQKIRSDGWGQLLSGYPTAIEECWRQFALEREYYAGNPAWETVRQKRLDHIAEIIRTGLTFTETLVGNGVFETSRGQAVTLSATDLKDGSSHMNSRKAIHNVVGAFLDDHPNGGTYKKALSCKLQSGYPEEAGETDKDKKAYKEDFVQSKIDDLVRLKVGNDIFSADNVEKVLDRKFGALSSEMTWLNRSNNALELAA